MEALSYCQLMERCLAAEARVVELTAENVAMKSAITDHSHSVHFCEVCGKDDPCSTDDVCYVLSQTPVTDRIVAAQRSAFVDEAVAKITESGALTFGDCIVALCQLRESAK